MKQLATFLFPTIVLLFGACAPRVNPAVTPAPGPTTTQTAAPFETPTSTPTALPSALVFPSITGDAGNFVLQAGETITFTWENPPAGADRYEFVLAPENKETPYMLGTDVDASDGVAVSWTVPEHLAAALRATAYFSDERKIESNVPMIYSGDFPPPGVCSLEAPHQPIEVYRLPDRTAEIFALLIPGIYARVLEIAPDGWYRIDASAAELYTRPRGLLPGAGYRDVVVSAAVSADSPASGEGWVNSDKGVRLAGSCPP